jgi:hypothetical protein
MLRRLPARKQIVAVLFLATASACGSSEPPSQKPDSGPAGGQADAPATTRDVAASPDLGADVVSPGDTSDGSTVRPDTPITAEVQPDASRADLAQPGLDLAQPSLDLARPDLAQVADGGLLDAQGTEASRSDAIATGGDARSDSPDAATAGADAISGGADAATTDADAPAGGADAAFQPGPATPIVVNSGNTAVYSLGDGTWKVFYFDTEAGQMYVVSGLGGITTGYLGTSASVSPGQYDKATDATTGTLWLTAPTAQRYYLAVGVSGGMASGSFQVADAGKPLALGTTTLSLMPADAGDYTHFVYRFPVTAGHGYSLTLQGTSQSSIGLSVARSPERSSGGELSYSDWGITGGLPFTDEKIPATSVANSTSGFYFIDIRISASINFTITITQTP